MNKYKVCVYAICKNEEKYAVKWAESMSEADEIYVLDTGSTDNTVGLLSELGVHVTTDIINPWRFDTARNKSLELLPNDTDICVCTDLDEVFHPGWRKAIENVWEGGDCQLRYKYIWSFNSDYSEGSVFWIDKIHSRNDFIWQYPIHETLKYTGTKERKIIEVSDIQLDHHPDPDKPRSSYLSLTKARANENPDDSRSVFYLGREYLFNSMWSECIDTLTYYLQMPTSLFNIERCTAMRYIAIATYHLGTPYEEEIWIYRAIAEAPYMREPWMDASCLAARLNQWNGSLYFAERALAIKKRNKNYLNEAESWGSKPYDLAAIAAYNLNMYDKALDYGIQALQLEPTNKRLNDNIQFYTDSLFNQHK